MIDGIRLSRADVKRFRVYVGMRHWHPFIKDTVAQMLHDGIRRVVAVSMAPQYSPLSVGAYRHALETAQAEISKNWILAYQKYFRTREPMAGAFIRHRFIGLAGRLHERGRRSSSSSRVRGQSSFKSREMRA
jgi:ferrochelatase